MVRKTGWRPIAVVLLLASIASFLFLRNPPPPHPTSSASGAGANPKPRQSAKAGSFESATERESHKTHPSLRASASPLSGTLANLRSKRQNISLTGDDGLFDRVMIDEKEPVQFSLSLKNLKQGEPILISAPNGGSLVREDGPLEFPATATQQPIKLNFEPSIGRGAYTIRIQHAGESQIIDLWAGAPNPQGQPGPAYIPSQFSSEVP